MKNNFYVYYLRRPDKVDPLDEFLGQPFYVGKGCNGRVKEHRRQAEKLMHKSGRKSYKIHVIHKLWKQGLDFQEDFFLDCLTEQEAFDIEKEAIAFYGRIDIKTGCLSNLTDGGDGNVGLIMSDETKKEMSRTRKGRPAPWNIGRGHSPEGIERIRQANLGKVHTKEFKQYLSDINKGKVLTEEHKTKISVSLMGHPGSMKGIPCPEERKERISKKLQGHEVTEETREKLRRASLRQYQKTKSVKTAYE